MFVEASINVISHVQNDLSIPVDRPTSEQLDAVQNSMLFEGDIIGMPSGKLIETILK